MNTYIRRQTWTYYEYVYTTADLEIEVEKRRVDPLLARLGPVVIFVRPPIRAHVRRRFLRKSSPLSPSICTRGQYKSRREKEDLIPLRGFQ